MHPPVSPTRAPRGAGFTLLELLVSIGIIAVLLGLLSPALRSARSSAQKAVCLSNQRQIAAGWVLYLVDYKTFPSARRTDENGDGVIEPEEQGEIHLMFDWGGVDWFSEQYLNEDGTATSRFSAERPLNSYVGSELHEQSRAGIFRCPSDNAVRWSDADTNPFYEQYGDPVPFYEQAQASHAEDAGQSVYSILGTSYQANDWIWAKVGSKVGYCAWTPGCDMRTRKNRPEFAEDPSSFTLTGDVGTYLFGRRPPSWGLGTVYGPWHGATVCNMSFLDGSARSIDMTPGGFGQGYSFWFDRRLHLPASVIYAPDLPGMLWSPPGFDDDEGDSGSGG